MAITAQGDGDFQQALEYYLDLIDAGYAGFDAHYNLANCYYQLGQYPEAVLHYERALRLRPLDRATRQNLALVNAQRDDAIVRIESFFLSRWVNGASNLLSPLGWAILSLLLLWSAIAFVIMRVRGAGSTWLMYAIGVTSMLCVIAVALGAVRLAAMRCDQHAVVMQDAVPVYVAPDPSSTVVRVLPDAGETVDLLDRLEEFYKVRLPNYEEGWIDSTTIRRI